MARRKQSTAGRIVALILLLLVLVLAVGGFVYLSKHEEQVKTNAIFSKVTLDGVALTEDLSGLYFGLNESHELRSDKTVVLDALIEPHAGVEFTYTWTPTDGSPTEKAFSELPQVGEIFTDLQEEEDALVWTFTMPAVQVILDFANGWLGGTPVLPAQMPKGDLFDLVLEVDGHQRRVAFSCAVLPQDVRLDSAEVAF